MNTIELCYPGLEMVVGTIRISKAGRFVASGFAID